ncbi:MAG: B12-binding domain-containing radical SAM protein, partial [Chloroflexota bacterium]|nr:B12-binding domain-containing radical SAM protein [Chloroflexota bacterium]
DGDYVTAIEKFRDQGIMLYGSFVFGYDSDTPATIEATTEFAMRARFSLVNFTALSPTPGSHAYERLRREGRLLYNRWWLDPSYRYGDVTFQPKKMTPVELAEACIRARETFYSYRSTVYRALEPRTNCRSPVNLGLFLLANYQARKEIFNKLGQPLGADSPLEPLCE